MSAKKTGRKKSSTKKTGIKSKISKKIRKPKTPENLNNQLPRVRDLLLDTFDIVRNNFWMLLGITLVYAAMTTVFVQGPSYLNVQEQKDEIDLFSEVLDGEENINTTQSLVGYVVSASIPSSQSATTFNFVLIYVFSLAFIWAIRHIYEEKQFAFGDPFYRGMYPLIPYVLVTFVGLFALIPFALCLLIFSLIESGGIATTIIQHVGTSAILLLGIIISGYFITSIIIASYIVCLPNTEPMAAIKAAREIVKKQRYAIFIRIIALPALVILMGLLLILVSIVVWPNLATLMWWLTAVVAIPLVHIYLYSLYRKLL